MLLLPPADGDGDYHYSNGASGPRFGLPIGIESNCVNRNGTSVGGGGLQYPLEAATAWPHFVEDGGQHHLTPETQVCVFYMRARP